MIDCSKCFYSGLKVVLKQIRGEDPKARVNLYIKILVAKFSFKWDHNDEKNLCFRHKYST